MVFSVAYIWARVLFFLFWYTIGGPPVTDLIILMHCLVVLIRLFAVQICFLQFFFSGSVVIQLLLFGSSLIKQNKFVCSFAYFSAVLVVQFFNLLFINVLFLLLIFLLYLA